MTAATHSPFLRRAELANSRWFGPNLFSFLATGPQTDHQFALIEMRLVPGSEPPPHTHKGDDEAFYVIKGDLEVRIGRETVRGRKGDFIFLPAGIEHAFQVLSRYAHILILTAPSGLDDAFDALSVPARAMSFRTDAPNFDPARFVAAFAECGLTFRSPNAPAPATRENPALAVRVGMNRSRWHLGNLETPLVGGVQTRGRIAVNEIVTRRGQELPPHVHLREDEGYYVLNGVVTFDCDGQSFAARPGDFVFLPRGLAHSFKIHSEVARMLVCLTPAGLENCLFEHSEPAGALIVPPMPESTSDLDALARVGTKYGLDFLPPAA
jgi:quercetin dioxygenase-like cupin family protein